jgi:hypothetical protein
MKPFSILAIALVAMSQSFAGIVGWLSSEPRDWKFVQSVGGIAIDPVIRMNGKPMLPVTCDVSGTTIVTCRPTMMNSGIVIRKFEVKHTGRDITIRVVTSLLEGTKASRKNHVDLSGIKKGVYQVYYETPGDPEKRLGVVEIE